MRTSGGFTLLEILVAVSILVIIVSVVYGAYTSNIDAIRRAQRQGEVYQVARIVLERMSTDLQGALVKTMDISTDTRLGFVAEDLEFQGKPADRIHFTSTAHLALRPEDPHTDLCEISYTLEEDTDGQGMVLYRRDDATPDDDMKEGGLSLELAKGIDRLEFRFLDAEGTEYGAWDSLEGMPEKGLPRLVMITIGILDERGGTHLFRTSVHPALSG